MKISSTQYSIAGGYLEIFISGCLGLNECRKTCHNPGLWSFYTGDEWDTVSNNIEFKINSFLDVIDYLVITGGEPMDQDLDELYKLISFLRKHSIPIILFTSYWLDEIPEHIKNDVDYIKCGPYDENFKGEKDVGIFKLASTNQHFYKREFDGWYEIKGDNNV